MKSDRTQSASKRYQAFLREGKRVDEVMRKSGLGHAADEVHAYLEAKVAGRCTRRPRPARWRQLKA